MRSSSTNDRFIVWIPDIGPVLARREDGEWIEVESGQFIQDEDCYWVKLEPPKEGE
jgi:hypothetical protein